MKTRFAALFAVAWGVLPVARLASQDVTVGDSVWASTDPVPEELPKAKGHLRPGFPDEMRKASEIGYAIIRRDVDPTGKARAMEVSATQVAYQRAVEDALRDWEMAPAKRGGKPVDTHVWIPVIFNLKSAAVKGPDATPRLLAVEPVVTHDRPAPAGQPPIVRLRLHLDAAGAVTAVEPEGAAPLKPRLTDDIKEALNGWRFAPARKDGQPVAADVVMPIICQGRARAETAKVTQPRPIYHEAPEYPLAMRRFRLGGQVIFDFEVDVDGKVVNPVVFESDNPAFDQPALEALFKWKFEPGTRDGKPVKTKMRVPIIFTLAWVPTETGITQNGNGDQSKLPPELKYDTPAKFRSVMLPVYPLEARKAGATGKASLAVLINPQGNVSELSVLSADRPEFGLALIAAVEGYRFDPAYKDGKPVMHLLKFEQEFNDMALADEEGDRLMTLAKKHPERIFGANKLDAPPVPRSQRPPVFPLKVPADVMTGEAMIEFLIDTDGHARLPRVVSASDPAFGYAGMQAVGTWLFTPPLVGGKTVVARAQIPLKFDAKPAKKQPKPVAAVPAPAATDAK